MKINKFLLDFEQQFDDLELNSITSETEFRSIPEWSSLSALLIISMIDSEYNVSINGEDIRNAKTVKDLFEKVSKQKERI